MPSNTEYQHIPKNIHDRIKPEISSKNMTTLHNHTAQHDYFLVLSFSPIKWSKFSKTTKFQLLYFRHFSSTNGM